MSMVLLATLCFLSMLETSVLCSKDLVCNAAAARISGSFRSVYLEGHGDLVSGLIIGIVGVIIWLIGVINSPHDPPSRALLGGGVFRQKDHWGSC